MFTVIRFIVLPRPLSPPEGCVSRSSRLQQGSSLTEYQCTSVPAYHFYTLGVKILSVTVLGTVNTINQYTGIYKETSCTGNIYFTHKGYLILTV